MRLSALTLALGLTLTACGGATTPAATTPTAATPAAAPAPAPSLYERLGGTPAITVVIDGFLANVVADARINKFFAGLDAAAVGKLRGHLIDQVCGATGGACPYTGRSMKESHAGMNLTDAHFAAIVEDLVTALDAAGVKPADRDELVGVLGGLKGDIVGQ